MVQRDGDVSVAGVWRPAAAYTGVDAWELRELLDSEPQCSASSMDGGAVALVRPYLTNRAGGASCG